MKYPEIAKRISSILSLRNMKQQDLADKTGINKASISQYINGSHCPSNATALLMSEALNVNYLWLMGFDVPMEIESDSNETEEDNRLKRFMTYYTMLNPEQKTLIDNMLKALSSKQ